VAVILLKPRGAYRKAASWLNSFARPSHEAWPGVCEAGGVINNDAGRRIAAQAADDGQHVPWLIGHADTPAKVSAKSITPENRGDYRRAGPKQWHNSCAILHDLRGQVVAQIPVRTIR